MQEQLLRGKGTVERELLVGAARIHDSKPRERKAKEHGGGKDVKREMLGDGREHREDGGGRDEMRVNVERYTWTFVGQVKAFPGRERGKPAISYWGILQGNDHWGGSGEKDYS